ncbi:hypothetical protein FRB99_000033 [Tulasnella sp. 403]|nr:hypothetical protein FRB99_000033 [Tulasnella sp. 403]
MPLVMVQLAVWTSEDSDSALWPDPSSAISSERHPSVALYYPAFSQFQKDLDDSAPLDPAYMDHAIKFVALLTAPFKTESDHQKALRPVLEQLLQGKVVQYVNPDKSSADSIVLYAPIGRPSALLLVIEVKNEICSDLFYKVNRRDWEYWSRHTSWAERSCCPSFILTIAGSGISVRGAVLLYESVAQLLTGHLWIRYGGNDNARARFVGKLFRALTRGISSLKQHYAFLPAQNDPQCYYPVIRSFPSIDKPGNAIKFTYKKHLLRGSAVFHVQTDIDARDLIVKFTYRYNKTAHKLLEQTHGAPKLLYVDPALDNPTHNAAASGHGPWVVVMEYVPGCRLSSATVTVSNSDKLRITAAVKQAVKRLHREGLVFGDLRLQNIVVTESETYLVDFD